MDVCIQYVLNGSKTNEKIYTAFHICGKDDPYADMMATKRDCGKLDGVQCYHIIQSFAPGEIEPEQALEIAKQFCAEHLPGHEAVIGTHIDKSHVHNVRPDRAMRKAV
jgi:hypothetical protein